MIKTFEDLIKLLTKRGARKRLAVVNGIDTHTQRAVEMALDEGVRGHNLRGWQGDNKP